MNFIDFIDKLHLELGPSYKIYLVATTSWGYIVEIIKDDLSVRRMFSQEEIDNLHVPDAFVNYWAKRIRSEFTAKVTDLFILSEQINSIVREKFK